MSQIRNSEQLAREFMQHFPERESTQIVAEKLRAAASLRKPSILIACMPKSGSTFLLFTLAAATGYPRHAFVYAFDRNEQDLYLPSLAKSIAIPTVTQQHVRATDPNLELIELFNLRPIVLVRNIFDVVVSYYDHCHREDHHVPAGYLSDDFFSLADDMKLDMIIDMVLPWYFGFFVSWQEAQRDEGRNLVWLTYEELFAEPVDALRRVLSESGIDVSAATIEQAIAMGNERNDRFNQGTSGRGAKRLSDDQKERIIRISRYYPSIDFSMIGIG